MKDGEFDELGTGPNGTTLFIALGSTWDTYQLTSGHMPHHYRRDWPVIVGLQGAPAERVREAIKAQKDQQRREARLR